MKRPDFAITNLERLGDGDLRLLIENFPQPGGSYEQIASVIHKLPSTLESMIESQYVFQKIMDRRQILLDVSPFLLFNVLLRWTLHGHRSSLDRKVINYLANLLSLFVKVDRLYRIQPGEPVTQEYIYRMLEEAINANGRRKFAIFAHIGNFTMFLTGMFPGWIDYRHRFKNRPLNRKFYEDQGRTYYHQAALHPLADEYRLKDVFLRLALSFDQYTQALNRMTNRYFHP